MENDNDESLIMNMPIEKTLGQGFISNDYMLIIKLFLYEIFATIVTWTITNIVRSIYRSYFQLPYDEEHNTDRTIVKMILKKILISFFFQNIVHPLLTSRD